MLREQRSASQILFNLLPEQTVDLKGRIWKVKEWRDPHALKVDESAVRRHLLSALDPWRSHDRDRGASRQLWEQHSLEVVELNRDRGVAVESWPQVWVCQACRRIGSDMVRTCECGVRRWSQLHFVGYHACGAVFEPYIPRCKTHGQVAVNSPRTAQAKDLRFACPVCGQVMLEGLGAGRPCRHCNKGGSAYTVHRASSVYTSHGLTMVNAPRPDQLADLRDAGGPARCLDWVLDGMTGQRPGDGLPSRASLVENLVAQGFSRPAAEAAADAMGATGQTFGGSGTTQTDLPEALREAARNEAQDLAVGVHNGRLSTAALSESTTDGELRRRYSTLYPSALRRAGLCEVDLVDRFPVLRGVFGYSRNAGRNSQPELVMFRGRRGAFRVYADSSETEALLLRLDPLTVVDWLRARGHALPSVAGEREAREAILRNCVIPARGEELVDETPGSAVLTLVHSYTHRLIRGAAVLAGIDRDALAEYLVPRHLSALVYAGSRGDFVLGGLQALFETDLDKLLDEVTDSESRCPLDPGCARSAGACLACLHLGEPSCTHYNRFLDRKCLTGRSGYLTAAKVGTR